MSARRVKTEETATIDAARIRRLTEFATDTAQMADQRRDLDLRALVDDLYRPDPTGRGL
jgi:hypothetical protein